METHRQSMLVVASAGLVGLVTGLILYYCSGDKRKSSADDSTNRVSVVLPFRESHLKKREFEANMGNSQSDSQTKDKADEQSGPLENVTHLTRQRSLSGDAGDAIVDTTPNKPHSPINAKTATVIKPDYMPNTDITTRDNRSPSKVLQQAKMFETGTINQTLHKSERQGSVSNKTSMKTCEYQSSQETPIRQVNIPPIQNISRERTLVNSGNEAHTKTSQVKTKHDSKRDTFFDQLADENRHLSKSNRADIMDTSEMDKLLIECLKQLPIQPSQKESKETYVRLAKHPAFESMISAMKSSIAHAYRQRARAEEWSEFLTLELDAHIAARIHVEDQLHQLQQQYEKLKSDISASNYHVVQQTELSQSDIKQPAGLLTDTGDSMPRSTEEVQSSYEFAKRDDRTSKESNAKAEQFVNDLVQNLSKQEAELMNRHSGATEPAQKTICDNVQHGEKAHLPKQTTTLKDTYHKGSSPDELEMNDTNHRDSNPDELEVNDYSLALGTRSQSQTDHHTHRVVSAGRDLKSEPDTQSSADTLADSQYVSSYCAGSESFTSALENANLTYSPKEFEESVFEFDEVQKDSNQNEIFSEVKSSTPRVSRTTDDDHRVEAIDSLKTTEIILSPPFASEEPQGFSFDDILKANLDYLSSDEEFDVDFNQSKSPKNTVVKEATILKSASAKNLTSKLSVLSTSSNENISGSTSVVKSSSEMNVSDSAKYWDQKLAKPSRDKVSEQKPDLDDAAIENIQKTKLKWEEYSSNLSGNDSGAGSGTQSRRRSLEEAESPAKLLRNRELFEQAGLALTRSGSFNTQTTRRSSIEDLLDQQDIQHAKVKWENLLEEKAKPEVNRRRIRLVSKTAEEMECDIMSLDVNADSIANVSNTKHKFEHLLRDDKNHTDRKKNKDKRATRTKATDFSSLRGKFELRPSNNEAESTDC